MASIGRTYTFSDGTDFVGSQVEAEISNIVKTWNNHDQGISAWTAINISGDITDTGAGKGLVVTTPNGLHTYRITVDNDGSLTTEALT